MVVFWDSLIAASVAATRPRSTLLVGGADGELVKRLIDATADWEGVVHVADPAPSFDIAALRRHAGNRILVHRARGTEVGGLLPVPDLLLLDTDPNWYTTHSLLQAAANQAATLQSRFPVTLLSNTGWPHARRDGYLDPASIPEPFRHPHERAGVRPNERALCASRGLFADRFHAVGENEPRNGVMTALEDFLVGHAAHLGVASLPFLHGISLIYPREGADLPAMGGILQAIEMGPVAASLAEATELARLDLAAQAADLRQAAEAARHRNEALHTALRDKQLAMRRKQITVKADTAPDSLVHRVRRRARRAARLATWAAKFQLAAQRRAERDRRTAETNIELLRASPIMNASWYLSVYQDVAASDDDPAAHYYRHGAAEGRDPGPYFSTAYYLARYPDIAEAGINPLLHYLTDGAREGRDPGPLFSGKRYLEAAPNAAIAGHNPLEHFLTCGQAEGRRALPVA